MSLREWWMKMDENIAGIVESIHQINQQAYTAYLPIVDDLCSRDASKAELERCMDYMLDFACDKRVLELYKRLCRRYLHTYPSMITYYINEYREMWDEESCGESENDQ